MKYLLSILLGLTISIPASALNLGSVVSKDLAKEINDVIGPPPAKGGELEIQDFAQMLVYQDSRTDEQCDDAALEAEVNLVTFFAGKHGPFTVKELNSLKPFLAPHMAYSGLYSLMAKDVYKRPRPYVSNPDIRPCIPMEQTTSAYPSGHTLVAHYLAQVLAEKFPQRRLQIEKRAEQIAENRVLGGVHHPTDITAGKKLALYLFQKMKKAKL